MGTLDGMSLPRRRRDGSLRPQSILDALPEGIVVLGRDGRVHAVNEAGTEAALLSPRKRDGIRVVTPDGRPVPADDLPGPATRRTGDPRDNVVLGLVSEAGDARWLSVSTRPLSGTDTLPCDVVVSFRDISDVDVMRWEIERRENRYRTILETIEEAVLVVDDTGRCIMANDKATALLGIDPSDGSPQLPPAGVRMLTPDGADMGLDEHPVAVAARAGRALVGYVHPIETPGAGRRWVRVNARPIVFDGRDAVVLSSVDVTDEHAARLEERKRSARERAILDNLEEGVVVYGPDGRVEDINPTAQRQLGVDRSVRTVADVLRSRRTIDELGAETDMESVMAQARATGEDVPKSVGGIVDAAGDVQWVEYSMRVLAEPAGAPFAIVASFVDVTGRRERQRALAEAEARLRAMFEHAPIGIGLLAPDGRIQQANHAWAEILGYTMEQLERMAIDDLAPGAPSPLDELRERQSGDAARARLETRHLRADGRHIWVQLDLSEVRDDAGELQHVVAQVQDVSGRRDNEARLEHLASHDVLTGLLNRRGFQAALEAHVAHGERYEHDGGVLMLDLDHFKYVNDTLGHQAGDELIATVARLLGRRLRGTDLLARLGGDEFAALIPHGDEAALAALADSLLEDFRHWRESRSDPAEARLSASIGLAACSPGLGMEDLLLHADLAMYEAKERGRDRSATYSSDGPPPRIKTRISWLKRLRQAIDEDGFELHAQPIVDLRGGRSEAMFEVLLRLRDEEGGLIAPGHFLELAERVDLIQEIDRLVVQRAAAILGASGSAATLTVNVSGKSFGDPRLLEAIATALRRSGVAPDKLVFEITETTAVSHVARAREFAHALRELGCRLAIDDFGAGFGSFAYVKHLPFDFLKIDGEFVSAALQSGPDAAIVRSVRHLAHGLGRRVIAEHCSCAAIAGFLRDEDIDYAQGFHLGHPVPLTEAI